LTAPAFRPADPGDADAIHELRRACNEEDGSPWAEAPARAALASLLAAPALGRVWVATDGGDIVGFVVLTFGFSLEFHGRDAFLDELYVRPSHRRRGLGAAALAILEETCREQGVYGLHLEVDSGNEPARALYRRWGFTGHARQLMTKWLGPRPIDPTTHRAEAE
jgi:ribosomal protein S18 acetylase RimI-like enzyme